MTKTSQLGYVRFLGPRRPRRTDQSLHRALSGKTTQLSPVSIRIQQRTIVVPEALASTCDFRPALSGSSRLVYYSTRLESTLLVLYLIMNIIFMFPGYDLFAGNLWYVDRYL
jgi:hypothetical protein